MPFSALVVTLDPAEAAEAVAALERDPRLSLGPRSGLRLPVALETAGTAEGEAVVRALQELPGVVFVDVVMVDVSDLTEVLDGSP